MTQSDLQKKIPQAEVVFDRGSYYAVVQRSYGQEVLGWGETVSKAVQEALRVYPDGV